MERSNLYKMFIKIIKEGLIYVEKNVDFNLNIFYNIGSF